MSWVASKTDADKKFELNISNDAAMEDTNEPHNIKNSNKKMKTCISEKQGIGLDDLEEDEPMLTSTEANRKNETSNNVSTPKGSKIITEP